MLIKFLGCQWHNSWPEGTCTLFSHFVDCTCHLLLYITSASDHTKKEVTVFGLRYALKHLPHYGDTILFE